MNATDHQKEINIEFEKVGCRNEALLRFTDEETYHRYVVILVEKLGDLC